MISALDYGRTLHNANSSVGAIVTETPAHANRMLFITLPVQDVRRSKAFFAQLGFVFDDCFSVASRDEVDTVADAAIAAGGQDHDDAQDFGFMRSRSFFDLDGHGWQVMWMDPAAAEQGPEAFAASMQDAERVQ